MTNQKTRIQRFKDWCCTTRRKRVLSLLALGLFCGAVGFLAGWIIYGLYGKKATLEVLKAVTAVGVIFAIWKILLDNWSGIWNFLKEGDRSQLSRPLSQVVVAFTGLGLFIGTDPPGNPPPGLQASLLIASSVIAGPDEVARTVDTRRIMLPYFNTNATDVRHGDVPPEALEKVCGEYLEKLATIDAAGIQSLRTLACGLRACSTPRHPVKIDVRGFASSRTFICGAPSADRNLELAERRRQNVIGILNGDLSDASNCASQGPRGDLTYEPGADRSRWDGDYELMQRSRDLVDVRTESDGQVDRMREILSRRVDVVVEDAGACGGATSSILASNASARAEP
jgi:hypothetical protein